METYNVLSEEEFGDFEDYVSESEDIQTHTSEERMEPFRICKSHM